MATKVILPKRTVDYLANGAPNGQRHEELKAASLQFRDAGINRGEAEAALRNRGTADGLKEHEIMKVVDWAYSLPKRSPIIVGNGNSEKQTYQRPRIEPPKPKQKTPIEKATWWLSGASMKQSDFEQRSQLKIPDSEKESCILFLEMLYEGADHLNVVCKFLKDDDKARPVGGGMIMSRDKWVEYVKEKGVPHSDAGAWFRPNPCKEKGSGKDGAISDSDIADFQFLMLESDVLTLELQFALFSRLKLPIAAVYLSGGSSAHALVRLGKKSAHDFSADALRITSALSSFGIDQANKNPSRLSRLPGAKRIIGAKEKDGAIQKLLWLNPAVKPLTESGMEAFELSLEIPAAEDKPFRNIVLDAVNRYEELFSNPGLHGTPTGLADFDYDTGGLKAGQMTVIAAETNGGKSTLALNIINGSLNRGFGVALFTMEMGNDEIADNLFAMNCKIDRGCFNTGRFTQGDMESMAGHTARIAAFKLWTYDDSILTVSEIRKRILALRMDGCISLAVVDYAQIVQPENFESPREQQVAAIARALCACAKDAAIPIIVLSQLNDEGKLRESRVIAHEAHNVLLIENKEHEFKMVLRVVKGRRIQKKDYELFYEPKFCRVASMSKTNHYDSYPAA